MNPEQVTDKMLQLGSTQEAQETEFVNHYMVDDDRIEYTIFMVFGDLTNPSLVCLQFCTNLVNDQG